MNLELLAPAGGPRALAAALEAGADAVYLGLEELNARRGARNFPHDALPELVRDVHAAGARAYLAVNIDLAEREVGSCARMLELARRAGADAVLVKDPALLLLRPLYPKLEFHLSTQAGAENSAAVRAAEELGCNRVVLAREMTLEEIRAASAEAGIGTEVFAQGAMCFSCSGHCLLSSWAGGHSGNRGMCASPCRVKWRAGGAAGHFFSMRDLSLAGRLKDLAGAGVACIKIEGRLKSAAWVSRAAGAYRALLDGAPPASVAGDLARLGDYTGREQSAAVLDGDRAHLTGADAGRQSGFGEMAPGPGDEAEPEPEPPAYELHIRTGGERVECVCRSAGREEVWALPKTRIRRPERAVAVGELAAEMMKFTIQDCAPGTITCDDDSFLLPKKNVKAIVDRVSAALHRARKEADKTLRLDLPDAVRAVLEKGAPAAENARPLGGMPDRIRARASAVPELLPLAADTVLIVEGAEPGAFAALLESAGAQRLIAALPPVFYEEEIPAVRELCHMAAENGMAVEVNSWGGWRIACETGARFEAGPGLAVLNSLAARQLGALGAEGVTASIEADREKLEDLSAACGQPLSIIIYGRPALCRTRVELPGSLMGSVLEDSRHTRVSPRREGPAIALRPEKPFDLTGLSNPAIRAAHLVADLAGSPDPAAEWRSFSSPRRNKFRFNYRGRLQ
jgi:U32 family peptidase